MKNSLLARMAAMLERRLGLAFVILFALVAVSAWGASRLSLNTNQIELLPQDMVAVKEAKRVSEMTGGIGFLMLALKGEDVDHMKRVADDLAVKLTAMPEVRRVRLKLDISWVRDHIGLYVLTPDLIEVRKRLKAKIKDTVRRNNPFHITLRKTEPVKLDIKDIVDKYKQVGKKGINDDYNISLDRKMVLLLIKPQGSTADLEFTRDLLAKIETLIAGYNKDNTRKATLKEGYRTLQPGATITYGYTGGYKLSLDDSDSIMQSLIPTASISVTGILLLLLIFLRRLLLVASLMTSLVIGVIFTFGFCYITVGELNSITAIMAGILMGQGIDFGIQFIYRLREEYTRGGELSSAIRTALTRLGKAAVTTACTTSAAFLVLATSDFKGFRDFGIVAGGGTFLIAGSMLLVTSMIIHAFHRRFPNYIDRVLRLAPSKASAGGNKGGKVPFSRLAIWMGVLVTIVLGVAASGQPKQLAALLPEGVRGGVLFDYDSRALMVKDRPSLVLQQEIKDRFQISADPAAVWTPTMAETEKLLRHMQPKKTDKYGVVDAERFSTVDAAISLFLFVPEMAQQLRNQKIMQQMKKDLEPIKPEMLEEKHRKYYKDFISYLDAKPFTLEELPDIYKAQFRQVPESKEKGFLTFFYPKVALWDSRDLLAFSNQVAHLKVGETTYHSTGMAILFARLSQIVLHDAKWFTVWAILAILLILLVDLRSLVGTLVALIPLVVGVTAMLGIMALLGQKMNFMNVVVFPVVLGYGMGNGVYILHRFRESGSALTAVTQTGRAVLASCVTTLVGWASLLTANHVGLESMGVLASLGIGCVLITSLVLLPAILQLLQGFFNKRWGMGKPADEPEPNTEQNPEHNEVSL